MRVGIYGGTFDPIHNGHLHVIEQLITRNIVDYLLVVPAGQPLLRTSGPSVEGFHRRNMCQLAISELNPEIKKRIEVNPIEVLRMGPSYAIDTVEAVKQAYPDDELVLVLGTDAYEKIDQWHRASELKDLVTFEVIQRPDHPISGARDIDALNISATQVRNKESEEIPPSVKQYIQENHLYGN